MVNSQGAAFPHRWPVWIPERYVKAPTTPEARGANLGIEPAYPSAGRYPLSIGPVIGPLNPGIVRHVCRYVRQIVRPTRESTAKCRDLVYLLWA
jgi:hypothetical protein